MRTKILATQIILQCFLAGLPLGARAEAPAEPAAREVILQDLLQEAREKNPSVRAAYEEWQAAKKRILSSWALRDPMAGTSLMGAMKETRTGPEEYAFMVSQEIPFPLKLWERRKIAKQEAEMKRQIYLAARRGIFKQVRYAYYELYAVDASLAVTRDIQNILKKSEASAQARYADDTAGQGEVAKAQIEASLALRETYLLEQEREVINSKINQLLNRNPLDTIARAARPALAQEERTIAEWLTLASRGADKIAKSRALVEKSLHARKLAQMEWIPDLEAGFVYNWVGSGETMSEEDGKDSWMFPLRVNVPLWANRIIPEIQAASREADAAAAKLKIAESAVYYQIKDAYTRYQTAKQILTLYDSGILSQVELALKSDQAGYESGRKPFFEFLDSERVYLNARLDYLKFYTVALKAAADLHRAAGLDLEEEKDA